MIFAQANYYGDTTNSIAEEKVLLQGLELCRAKGINEVDIEVDSIILVQVIEKKTGVP